MASAPIIFDKPLLRSRLRRALRAGPASFLLDHALLDLGDRLSAINRRFDRILELGAASSSVADALLLRFAGALVVRAAPDASAIGKPAPLALVADEELSPFKPGTFDLCVSLLALQWANDLPGALVQVRRTLKPDGLFIACLVGGLSLKELRFALAAAEEEMFGGASPRVAPFVDLRDLGALLQRAGLALPVTDVEALTVRYRDLFGLLKDLRAMGAGNALADRSRRPLPRAGWLRAAEIYAQNFSDPDGRVRATFELVWLSGWAPHESQQKPLAPGSARMRLADALGVRETKLKP